MCGRILQSSWIIFLIYITVFSVNSINGVQLDSDGGYRIVVGISEDIFDYVDLEPEEYLEQIQEVLKDFATLLYESTESVFHVKSVEIVIPEFWAESGVVQQANVSTKASYKRADIQISNTSQVPSTENYYHCGRPGIKINLPPSFITVEGERNYGHQYKGLLNLWLRYRFGVWEEHGFPSHPTNPYVYTADDVSSFPYILTSCNDTTLDGEYANLDEDEPDDYCDPQLPYEMSPTCRFRPLKENDDDEFSSKPTSSLMNFNWVHSIDKLCNASTHEKRAPNRQNLYCNFQSIWEVIKSSADYQMVQSPYKEHYIKNGRDRRREAPEIVFNVVAESQLPLFYVLLDTGAPIIQTGDEMYRIWLNQISNLTKSIQNPIISTLNSYPNPSDNTTEIYKAVDWTNMEFDRDEFLSALDFEIGLNESSYDLRPALIEAIEELKLRDHAEGAVLLVLRTGDGFEAEKYNGIYEEDIALDLKLYGITLCAIEIGDRSGAGPTPRLQYLAAESVDDSTVANRTSAYISDPANAADLMKPVLQFILEKLNRPATDGSERIKYTIIYKDELKARTEPYILVPKRTDIEILEIRITSQNPIDYIRFQLPDGEPFIEWREWNEMTVNISGYTYSKKIDISSLNETGFNFWAWELYIVIDDEDYAGIINIYGTSYSRSLLQVTSNPPVNMHISTSALLNKFWGCQLSDVNEEPLAIFAKFTTNQEQTPIFLTNSNSGGSTLRGQLLNLESGLMISTTLHDSGYGADLKAGDGIYSGYVYPREEGKHRLFVTFMDSEKAASAETSTTGIPIGTLLSINQLESEMELTINGTSLNTPYSVVADSPIILHVTSRCERKRYITRISDNTAEIDEKGMLTVRFTVPTLITSHPEEEDENLKYFMGLIRHSYDLDILINNTGQEEIKLMLIDIANEGTQVEEYFQRNDSLFTAIDLLDFGSPPTRAPTSNIARVKGQRPTRPGSTTLPTTTLPPPTTVAPTPSNFECSIVCIIAVATAALGILITIVINILCCIFRRRRQNPSAHAESLTNKEVKEFLIGNPEQLITRTENDYFDTSELIQSLPYDPKYEIPKSKLHIDKTELLGSGAFAHVYKGYVVNLPSTGGKVLIVAVKTMRPNADILYFKALLSEVKLMSHIGSSHPNIVHLIGACTKHIRKREVYLAIEYCSNGNLLQYLQKVGLGKTFQNLVNSETGVLEPSPELYQSVMNAKPNDAMSLHIVSTLNLIKWSREIAYGMEYLGSKKIIHGDLAARNVLLDTNYIAKISDFGLSRQLVQYSQYAVNSDAGPMPWKWMAPETLRYMKFSISSDVWAYGVTVWELFSLGQNPYPGGDNWNIRFVDQLERGELRMGRPEYATEQIYQELLNCWNSEPNSRPEFLELKNVFDKMLVQVSSQDYLELCNYDMIRQMET